jgi:hypothetical protein
MPAKKAKKAGRPKLAKGKAFGQPKAFRFLDGELAAYEKAAGANGLSLSEWVRKTLNEAVQQ